MLFWKGASKVNTYGGDKRFFLGFIRVNNMTSFSILNICGISLILAASLGCKSIQQRKLPTELSGSNQQLYSPIQLNSYGNCKVANLEEIFSDEIVPVMVCYADLQKPETSAAIGAYVDPKEGWFAVLYRGDQLRDVIFDQTAEWIETRFDKGEINNKLWLSWYDWEWASIQNELEYFDDFFDRLAVANRLALRVATHGHVDEDTRYDVIPLNGTQAAISDFRGRIQGLRGAMQAKDQVRYRREHKIQIITSHFIDMK